MKNSPPPAKPRFGAPPLPSPNTVNDALLDRFTPLHFIFGAGVAIFGLGLTPALFFAFGWTIVATGLKVNLPWLFRHPTMESWKNLFADMIAVTLGWITVHMTVF